MFQTLFTNQYVTLVRLNTKDDEVERDRKTAILDKYVGDTVETFHSDFRTHVVSPEYSVLEASPKSEYDYFIFANNSPHTVNVYAYMEEDHEDIMEGFRKCPVLFVERR